MILTKDTINCIQVNLEPGYVLELTLDDKENVSVLKRPPKEGVIEFSPMLISATDRTQLQLRVQKGMQDAIQLAMVDIEPNTWIRGLLTCKGISQEMENGS